MKLTLRASKALRDLWVSPRDESWRPTSVAPLIEYGLAQLTTRPFGQRNRTVILTDKGREIVAAEIAKKNLRR